jgi:hypothetical protein
MFKINCNLLKFIFIVLTTYIGINKSVATNLPPTSAPNLSQNQSNTPTFIGDWETGSIIGNGNHYWSKSAITPNSSFTLKNDGGARQGNYYSRVEVAPGGCTSCPESAGMIDMKNSQDQIIYENENSGTQRYSFSVKFDSSWKASSSNSWALFMFLSGPQKLATAPAWEFNATYDKIEFRQRSGDLNNAQSHGYNLLKNSLNKGKWIDFILTVKYAKDNTGFYIIQRRDEGESNYTEVLNIKNVPSLQYKNGPVGDHSIKYGLFRNKESFTNILYLDGFTRETVGNSPAPILGQIPSVDPLPISVNIPNPIKTPPTVLTPPAPVSGQPPILETTPIGSDSTSVGESITNGESTTISLADKVQKIMIAKCMNCHSPQLSLGNINNVVNVQAMLAKKLIVIGNSANSKLYQVVAANQMPLGSPLDETSKKNIADWINAGAAEFTSAPNQFMSNPNSNAMSDTLVMSQSTKSLESDMDLIFQDIEKTPVATQAFIRYLITTQNYNSSALVADQKILFMKGISKALNSLHWKTTLTPPIALNQENTALRIDLRDYSLSSREWTQITSGYPYLNQIQSFGHWGGIVAATKSSIPILRGDWFVQRVLQPDIYKALLEIPDNIQNLETRLGVKAQESIQAGKVIRAGIKNSGVSFSNRVIERYESSFGPYWKSYDFINSQGKLNIFNNPLGPIIGNFNQNIGFVHNGGEMIFTLPNGLHGYVLTNANGDYLNTAPPEIVQDGTRADKLVSNSSSCFTCHTSGWIPIQDDIRNFANKSRQFNTNQLAAINRLYVPSVKLDETFNKDISGYVATLNKLEISPNSGEPVSTINLYYARRMQIKDLAAELNLSVADLTKDLEKSSTLRSLFSFTNNRNVDTVNISRLRFEQRFNQILSELKKISP